MKRYKWHKTEIEQSDYNLTNKPFMGFWEWFAAIGLIILFIAAAWLVVRIG